jgi:hypothetical protein
MKLKAPTRAADDARQYARAGAVQHLIASYLSDACCKRGFKCGFLKGKTEMTIEVPAEMIRLLGILTGCPNGAMQHELITEGVQSSMIYKAVMLNLVRVKQELAVGQTTYRFEILPAGIQLLGVQE